MAKTGVKWDTLGWVLFCLSLAAIGAGALMNHAQLQHWGNWLFYGGLIGAGLLIALRLFKYIWEHIQSAPDQDSAAPDNRGGNFVGRDNSGQQNIFHGPVNITHAVLEPNADYSAEQINRRQSADIEATLARAAAIPPVQPDWTLRELFSYLAPKGFADKTEMEAIGRDVIDRFSAKSLAGWGHEIVESKRLALARIDGDDWRRAKFVYWFLEGAYDEVSLQLICENGQRGVAPRQFAGIRLVRSNAEAIWPNDRVALQSAARMLYEAAEVAGVGIELLRPSHSTALQSLDRFKCAFMSEDAELRGVRPPSSNSLVIQKSEYAALQPVTGESRLVYHSAATGHAYDNVTIGRREMEQVIHRHVRALLELQTTRF